MLSSGADIHGDCTWWAMARVVSLRQMNDGGAEVTTCADAFLEKECGAKCVRWLTDRKLMGWRQGSSSATV